MSTREAFIAQLEGEPFRSVLVTVSRSPLGLRVLNRLSYPRAIFSTFEEAQVAAAKMSRLGHEHPEAVTSHLRLSQHLRQSDYAALYWIERIGGERVRVFDFGGNVGNLYYSYASYLKIEEWIVLDLPRVVERGRELARERKAGVTFADSAASFSRDHLLFISGAFHYWDRSVSAFIQQFPERPRHILINRTPTSSRTFYTVQETPSYAVACCVHAREALIAEFTDEGYILRDTWTCPELRIRTPLFPALSVEHYTGLYLEDVHR